MNCTYDNPETNIREFWRDGSPIYAEAKATIEHLISKGHTLEPWRSGVIVGDLLAMKKVEVKVKRLITLLDKDGEFIDRSKSYEVTDYPLKFFVHKCVDSVYGYFVHPDMLKFAGEVLETYVRTGTCGFTTDNEVVVGYKYESSESVK